MACIFWWTWTPILVDREHLIFHALGLYVFYLKGAQGQSPFIYQTSPIATQLDIVHSLESWCCPSLQSHTIFYNPQKGAYGTLFGDYGGFEVKVSSIGDALFTKTQQKVPGLLFAKPDESFYTNEIMRRVAMGRGSLAQDTKTWSPTKIKQQSI